MYEIKAGCPLPFGATVYEGGVNFSIFSRHASSVTLVVFEKEFDEMPFLSVEMDSVVNRTGDVWHCFVSGIREGFWYAYRFDGLYAPLEGKRYNVNKMLLDPYAPAISQPAMLSVPEMFGYDLTNPMKDLSFSSLRSDRVAPRGCVIKDFGYSGAKGRKRKLKDHIIYEMHVKGFTKHPSSGVKNPGTFDGIIEKIPYLGDLGITAVELMPVHAFDDQSVSRTNARGEKLHNYWGYDPINFFALHRNYAADKSATGTIEEFRRMVDAMHKADIDVFVDVVFNHTSEGSELGPTFSFKGVDNQIYYILDEQKRRYKNFTGCGNTVNCNHVVVRDLIVDTLLYWVIEYGIDGFRFDLASVLSRNVDGSILPTSPLLERIAEHPVLRNVVIIAEAWDAGGAYQVGSFGGVRWAEWNGKFRDDIRAFIKADKGSLGAIADRLTGSAAMYTPSGKSPESSINFITAHDGFTLYDLYSYNEKHNDDNGEQNRDGFNDNKSWNCGVEGETQDPQIRKLRFQLIKNAMAINIISLGVPMILAGDEFARTQKGNNNAYCQDNDISWIDWSLLEKNKDLYRFTKLMIDFRKRHPALRRKHFYKVPEGAKKEGLLDITWYGDDGKKPEWKPDKFHLAFLIKGWIEQDGQQQKEDDDIFVILNSHWESHSFIIPRVVGKHWQFVCDTSKMSPEDFMEPGSKVVLANQRYYKIAPRSVVILIAKPYNVITDTIINK